jgi:hypothetical protein
MVALATVSVTVVALTTIGLTGILGISAGAASVTALMMTMAS